MFFEQMTPLDKALSQGTLPKIETFDCPYDTSKTQTGAIRIVFPEFTCVCPKTGYPDFGAIHLYYLPGKKCVELKAWKLYLNSFRMIGTFHETVTSHLFNTVMSQLEPKWAMVVGDFFPRGNVDTTVVFESDGTRPREFDALMSDIRPHCKGFGE